MRSKTSIYVKVLGEHTLYPEALFEISSTLPWMLSIGLDWVGMFSWAVPAAVLSAILSAMFDVDIDFWFGY